MFFCTDEGLEWLPLDVERFFGSLGSPFLLYSHLVVDFHHQRAAFTGERGSLTVDNNNRSLFKERVWVPESREKGVLIIANLDLKQFFYDIL